MENKKSYYKELKTANGFKWVGFWDGLHRFQKGNYRDGFLACSVTESDIEDKSYLFMLKNDLSRVEI